MDINDSNNDKGHNHDPDPNYSIIQFRHDTTELISAAWPGKHPPPWGERYDIGV